MEFQSVSKSVAISKNFLDHFIFRYELQVVLKDYSFLTEAKVIGLTIIKIEDILNADKNLRSSKLHYTSKLKDGHLFKSKLIKKLFIDDTCYTILRILSQRVQKDPFAKEIIQLKSLQRE